MIFLRTFDGMLPMQLGVSKELQVFLLSCLAGAALGILYIPIRALRIILPHFKAAVFTEDMLFGLFCGSCYFIIFSSYSLSMRWFIAFAMGLSGVIIHILAGTPIIRLIKAADSRIKRRILKPLAGFIAKKGCKIKDAFVQVCQNCYIFKKTRKNRLKPDIKKVYNNKVNKHPREAGAKLL